MAVVVSMIAQIAIYSVPPLSDIHPPYKTSSFQPMVNPIVIASAAAATE